MTKTGSGRSQGGKLTKTRLFFCAQACNGSRAQEGWAGPEGKGTAVVWTDTRYASRRLCLDSDCCDGGAASQQSFSSMFCMSCLSRACLGKSSCVVRFPYRAMRTQKEEAIMAACCFLQMQPLCPATGATGRSKHLLPHPESSDQNQCTRLVQAGPRCSL